jgi:predicted Zn-dependent protease
MARTRDFTAGQAPGTQGGALLAGQILLESGRFGEAAQVFDSLAAFPPPGAVRGLLARHKTWMLSHLATTHAAAGDTAALEALLEPLRAWGTRSSYGRDRRLYHHANGLLLVARGRPGEAAAEFQRAIYSTTFGYTRTNYELARTLLALGRVREAVAVIQPALRGALDGSNLYITRTELRELLARAYEAGGEVDSAAVYYGAVLTAWQNADPAFDLRRESVRERIAALGRTSGTTR